MTRRYASACRTRNGARTVRRGQPPADARRQRRRLVPPPAGASQLWRWREPSRPHPGALLPIPVWLPRQMPTPPGTPGGVGICGGGGNRTRVHRCRFGTSPGAATLSGSRPSRFVWHCALTRSSYCLIFLMSPQPGHSVSPLNDADIFREDYARSTDFGARSGGEGEISALCIGTYCFSTDG